MGGPTGEAYLSTLNATGLSKEEVLAREAVQNTSDAFESAAQKATIRFRKVVLQGAAAESFLDASKAIKIGERRTLLGLAGHNVFERRLSSALELPLLYVEDYGTCGLFGKPHDPGSHFYRLLLSLGDSAKSRERDDSGGSYGFGKAAYFLNSRIHTIIAYSGFKQEDRDFESRLFGCGFFQRHEVSNRSFTGRAWLGIRRSGSDATPIVDPVVDAAAGRLAVELGFAPRTDVASQGTSMLIVDADIDLESLTKALETWWWPKLLEHDIDVSIVDEASGQAFYPRPKRRDDLKPFMIAYEIASGRADPARPYQKREEFNRTDQLSTGSCGLVALSPEQDAAIDEDRRNCVALIRGHRMVIQYLPACLGSPPIVGAFIGASDAERYLKLSEPPAHNQWDYQADRLSVDNGRGRRVVKSIVERIKRKARDFQDSATPPAPPRANRLQRLERALGRYFMLKDDGLAPPEPVDAPIHLSFIQEPTTLPGDAGTLRMKCKFEVRLKEKVEAMRLRLRTSCVILEDETHLGDPIAFELKPDIEVSLPVPADPTTVEFELTGNERAKFSILTSAYDPNWSLKFRPEVTPA